MAKPNKPVPAEKPALRATMDRRFMRLAKVAEILDVRAPQVYALVRSGELPAIKVGGRGQWRVEASELDAYIGRMYDQTKAFVATAPFPARAVGAGQEESSD